MADEKVFLALIKNDSSLQLLKSLSKDTLFVAFFWTHGLKFFLYVVH